MYSLMDLYLNQPEKGTDETIDAQELRVYLCGQPCVYVVHVCVCVPLLWVGLRIGDMQQPYFYCAVRYAKPPNIKSQMAIVLPEGLAPCSMQRVMYSYR